VGEETDRGGGSNFERHFQEPRHQYGMRCLQVPNTKHFQGIINIQDAYARASLSLSLSLAWSDGLAVFEKLKKEGTLKEWNPDREEELEDADGNVYSKKTFDELRRQGII
jgi:splicing factor 3A subunit 3